LFFANGFGDADNIVYIYDKAIITCKHVATLSEKRDKAEFLGHFTVKTEAYLSEYDCNDVSIYTFSKGRYFVYLLEPLVFHIEKIDEDTYA